MKNVVVIGAGPAGMMAAASAASAGARVVLLEKMPRVGRKLSITGNGRCNITAAVSREQLVKGFPGNGRFLHSAFSALASEDLIAFFASRGVATKVEADGRVFPASDNAEDVVAALFENALKAGVKVLTSTTVQQIEIEDGHITGVTTSQGFWPAQAVIVATGGQSYPGTGSTGDGYAWAETAGHRVVSPRPGLAPLIAAERWIKYLQGLGVSEVEAVARDPGGKVISRGTGDLMFTHFGLSGPLILALSKNISTHIFKKQTPVKLQLDFKPNCSAEQLDWQLQKLVAAHPRKLIRSVLADLLPPRLVVVILEQAGIDDEKACHHLTRAERQALVNWMKCFTVNIVNTRPIAEAIVTAGGVDVKEVNPRTMESKKVKGLYFAGELLDVDGYTGGYNLQAAFSTGYVAGLHAAE